MSHISIVYPVVPITTWGLTISTVTATSSLTFFSRPLLFRAGSTAFSSLQGVVSEQTLKAVEGMGFTHMTEIQAHTIPPLLDGRWVPASGWRGLSVEPWMAVGSSIRLLCGGMSMTVSQPPSTSCLSSGYSPSMYPIECFVMLTLDLSSGSRYACCCLFVWREIFLYKDLATGVHLH